MGKLQFWSISIPRTDWWLKLQQKVREDPFYTSLTKRQDAHQLTLQDGTWFQNSKVFLNSNSKVFLNSNSTLILLILSHFSPVGNHFGFHKPLHCISRNFIWPKMQKEMKDCLKTCKVCQQYATYCIKHGSLLQPPLIPTQSWINEVHEFHTRLSHGKWILSHHGGSWPFDKICTIHAHDSSFLYCLSRISPHQKYCVITWSSCLHIKKPR